MASLYRELTKILSTNGYSFLRSAKGDHEIWRSESTGMKVTVDAGIASHHTANEILKKAGLPKAF
jgi:predicted RNA binding protein YcfA (HicA-like mRNA interferase family)